MNDLPEYPKFYRLQNRCIKRDSDTTAIEIKVPESYKHGLPLNHSQVIFPSKARLDEEIEKMELVDQEIYEGYLYKFFLQSDHNKAQLDLIRLNRQRIKDAERKAKSSE
jgi:hypothetical protein